MSKVHGKNTYISLAGVNISRFTNASEINRTADTHDTTVYGDDAHGYDGGLLDGTAKCSGFYDNSTFPASAAGPRALINALVGELVEYIRRAEGTGSGKAQDRMNVVIKGYTETSPVADMVTWSCDMQISGDVDSTPQSP